MSTPSSPSPQPTSRCTSPPDYDLQTRMPLRAPSGIPSTGLACSLLNVLYMPNFLPSIDPRTRFFDSEEPKLVCVAKPKIDADIFCLEAIPNLGVASVTVKTSRTTAGTRAYYKARAVAKIYNAVSPTKRIQVAGPNGLHILSADVDAEWTIPLADKADLQRMDYISWEMIVRVLKFFGKVKYNSCGELRAGAEMERVADELDHPFDGAYRLLIKVYE